MAYLDGSYLWKDYFYGIRLKNSEAKTVMLLSRYKSSVDYTACSFSPGAVRIINFNDSDKTLIKDAKLLENETLTNGTILSMSVEDSNVSCYINGRRAINSEVPEMSPHGGVGVKAEGFDEPNKTFAFGDIFITEQNLQ